ncbi:synaptotagmin-15-like isoform X2 [Dendronephthya gigantea]|nr:synaptotagmin-15-like isoform X2 [Dendronephthya gigantea]
MFIFFRRRRKNSSESYRKSPSRAVKHRPVTVQTSTHQLTSSGPIPAAPDYSKSGLGRRTTYNNINNNNMLENSSSEEEGFDGNELVQRFDWSSPRRRKNNSPSKEDVIVANNTDEDRIDAGQEDIKDETNYPLGHIGRIWFRTDYQSATEKLQVNIIRIRHLPNRDDSNVPPDPQVRLYLLPDDRCQHQTEVKRKTRNPNFCEVFNFQVARDHLRQRVLRLSVYDHGEGRRGDVIGHVLYSLKDEAFGGSEIWRDFETLSEVESKLGDLHVSLAHYPILDRLTVIVLRAINLPLYKGMSNPDTYVKVTFSKGNNVLKVKKTNVKCGTIEPFYNETFHINATSDDLPACSLLLSVYQSTGSDATTEGKLIGRVLLGGMMYARGKELEHWTDMLCQPRTMVKYWHSLGK